MLIDRILPKRGAAALPMLLAVGLLAAAAVPTAAAPVPLTSLTAPAGAETAPTSPVEGSWRADKDGSEITVAPCGQGFCGSLSWVVIPKEFHAQCKQMDRDSFIAAMVDDKNPDASQRSRPILGLTMLTLKPTNDANTFDAHIYNVQDGKSYDISAWVVNNGNTLRIGGGCFAGICAMTEDWPRVAVRPTPDYTCGPG
ncbi:MAG TPA: DUF2147 domain-containing protein [Rhizomicrobium sp.]|nr:DUF2147 domain-containing protein [Rhizomicrobium sp.]